MSEQQITVTEENDWEGETFNYTLNTTPEIIEKIKSKLGEDPSYEIGLTSYTHSELIEMDKLSKNSYMSEWGMYELNKGWELDDDPFYKGRKLTHIK